MSIDRLKFDSSDFSGQDIASLPDNPSAMGVSTAELKARFDNIGKIMIALGKHNELISALMSSEKEDSGAKNIGATKVEEIEGENVQNILESLKGHADTKIPKTDVVQMRGRSESRVMSQKAVTDAIDAGGGNSGGGGEFEPIGCMKFFAGKELPDGYLWCDGASYSVNGVYKKLYEVIGGQYKEAGDTEEVFRVPDMRGRVGVGKNSTTFNILGKKGGEETHKLTVPEMPAHTIEQNAHSHNRGTIYNQATQNNPGKFLASNDSGVFYTNSGNGFTVDSGGTSETAATNKPIGSNAPHNNLQPYLVCNYIIKYDRSYEEIGVTTPPCIWEFEEDEWYQQEDGRYVLNIPESGHRRGEHCVLTALYDMTEVGKKKAVLFEMEKDDIGNITIRSERKFQGMAYIDRIYLVPAGRVLSVNGYTPDMEGDVKVPNKNLLINGGFQVWQRGTSFAGSSYTADRWKLNLSAGGSNIISVAPLNTIIKSGIKMNLSLSSDRDYNLIHYLEWDGTERELTLSFHAKVFSGTKFCCGYWDENDEQSNLMIMEGTGEWKTYTMTFTSHPKDRLGIILFSSKLGADNNINVECKWAKLEYGELATSYVPKNYAEEVAACKRYYTSLNGNFTLAYYDPTRCITNSHFFAEEMRVAPTFSFTSADVKGIVILDKSKVSVSTAIPRAIAFYVTGDSTGWSNKAVGINGSLDAEYY